MKLMKLGVLVAGAAIVVAACSSGSSSSPAASADAGASKGTVKVGISLPLSGSSLASAGPARDGALLAIGEIQRRRRRQQLEDRAVVLDHSVNGVHDHSRARTCRPSSPAAVVMSSAFNSSVAKVQIPISNEAGLLQCSGAHEQGLTKPRFRRPRDPQGGRTRSTTSASPTDVSGPGGGAVRRQTLGLKSVFIIDTRDLREGPPTTSPRGGLGGTVVGREGPQGTTDYADPHQAKSLSGLRLLRRRDGDGRRPRPADAAGRPRRLPYMGGDGIQDGNGSVEGSFITIAGPAAANSYSSVAAIAEIPDAAAFTEKYKAKYGVDPGSYSANGYACAQVVIDAIKTASAAGEPTREAVRAAGANTATAFQTVLGPVQWDANGDTSQKIISSARSTSPVTTAGRLGQLPDRPSSHDVRLGRGASLLTVGITDPLANHSRGRDR
jgi:branched-chain amino acid transport system substrate-binding protein